MSGYKRKREYGSGGGGPSGGHEFRPRQNPYEQQKARIRRSLAELGEPGRRKIEAVLQQVAHDIETIVDDGYPGILEMIRAVVYEQPHKIGWLSLLIELVNRKKPTFAFIVVEMVHEQLIAAIESGDYDKFKLFLRFACALDPILEQSEDGGLEQVLLTVLSKAKEIGGSLGDTLWASAVYAALYLTDSSEGLQAELASYEPEVQSKKEEARVFFGPTSPYEMQPTNKLLHEAIVKLREDGWDLKFMHNRKGVLELLDSTPTLPTGPGDMPTSLPTGPPTPAPAPIPIPVSESAAPVEADDSYEPAEPAALPSEPSEPPGPSETAKGADTIDSMNTDDTKKFEALDAEETKGADADGKEQRESGAETEEQEQKEKWERHRFPPVHLPADLPTPQTDLDTSDLWLQLYLPQQRETVPAPNHIFGLLLRDVAASNIRHMSFNRREVARQLITLDLFFNGDVFAPPGTPFDALADLGPEQPTWKVEDVALEAVLAHTLHLPIPHFPVVYYDTILIEACIMAPQSIAPVLGRALRFLFENSESLDAECLFRVVDWFAHHVSNFAFTWKWQEWVDALGLPTYHPKQVFMRELLAKQVRLSYPQRVRDGLPDEFVSLVPDVPDPPVFPYEDDASVEALRAAIEGEPAEVSGSGADAKVETATAEVEAEGEAGAEASEDSKQAHTVDAAFDALSAERGEKQAVRALVTVICALGNRSLSHVRTWLEQTRELLHRAVHKDPELQREVVDAVLSYREHQQWVGALVLEEFVRAEIVDGTVLVRYVVAKPSLVVSLLGWEILARHRSEVLSEIESLQVGDDEWSQWWTDRLKVALRRWA